MCRKQAEIIVDAIFADLRNRRFLKWLFVEDPENMAPILYERDGTPLEALDREVQAEIREAWIGIIIGASERGGGE